MEGDEYPNEETLKKIETWDITKEDAIDLISFIKENWKYADDGYFSLTETQTNKFKLKLATAGWSGNEDIISALKPNMFWTMYWQKSERGGCYYFEGRCRRNELFNQNGQRGYMIKINDTKYGVSATNIGIATKKALHKNYIQKSKKMLNLSKMNIIAEEDNSILQKIAVKKMLSTEHDKYIITL